jgi:hypothetical protein
LDRRELLSTIVLPVGDPPEFAGSMSLPGGGGIASDMHFGAGDLQGTLDNSIALRTYSVDLTVERVPAAVLNATVTTDGTIFGKAIPNAGAIAWLLTNIGPKVTSNDQEAALQAAIWRTEYGTNLSNGGFQLDGAENSNIDTGYNDAALIDAYKADIAALGSNTAPINSVMWIAPSDSYGNDYQGLVSMKAGVVEPLSLPNSFVPLFDYQYIVPNEPEPVPEAGQGGNFLGTLNNTTKLVASYCLSIDLGISTPHQFNAILANTPSIYNLPVPNAGAIAWLVTHIGPTATTGDQQDALQAAIWHEEYGNPGFQLDGVDDKNRPNNPTLIADYRADLASLGSNTAPVTSVDWITPYEVDTGYGDQGLVALPAVTYATKASLGSSVTPAAYGRTVTFGATVSDVTSPGGPTPTGSVQFQINGANFGKPVPLSTKGTATVAERTLGVGTYTINAVYIPTGNFSGITSPNYMQSISPDVIAVSVKSSLNPATKKEPVSFTAIVANKSPGSSAVPLGTVVFKIDGQTKGSAKLSGGKAVLSGIKLAAGTHAVTVYYTPLNTDFDSGQGLLTGGEKVNK